MQLLAAESDIGHFRLPEARVLSYGILPAGKHLEKEFRLSSKRGMASIVKSLEDMLSRACMGLMTNSTLLAELKVSQKVSQGRQYPPLRLTGEGEPSDATSGSEK